MRYRSALPVCCIVGWLLQACGGDGPGTGPDGHLGSIDLTVVTQGTGADSDGYIAFVDSVNRGAVAGTGTTSVPYVAAGTRTVLISGVSPFCSVGGENPASVVVPAGGAIAITFHLFCDARPAGRIAYVNHKPSGIADIRVMNSDGGGDALLVSDGESPAWSPDGTRLVFLREPPGSSRYALHRMNADGSDVTLLSAALGFADPRWGAGQTIVLAGYVGPLWDIFLIQSDGTGFRPLLPGGTYRSDPALSPDGRHVVFSAWEDPEKTSLWIVDIDGGNLRQLTSGFIDLEASWSPDSRRIAFLRYGLFDLVGLFVIDADGSGLHTVSDGLTAIGSPDWSPDGEWIAVASWLPGRPPMLLLRADGSRLIGIEGAPGGFFSFPRWGP